MFRSNMRFKNWTTGLLAFVLAGGLSILLGMTLLGSQNSTASPAATPVAEVTPSPTQTLAPSTDTPVPATATATSALPTVAIPATVTAQPSDTPAPAASTPAPTKPAVARSQPPAPRCPQGVLPNGVCYGERRPNISNRIVRIASPNIKLDTGVYEVYAPKGVWEVADYAAGHQYNSANPGEGGNVVLAGHNNWRGEVFRYLEFLQPGNEIDIWTLDGKEYKYTVQTIEKLLEAGATLQQRLQNGKVMDPTPFEQLTLITCWPYTTFTHRLIVIAKPAQ